MILNVEEIYGRQIPEEELDVFLLEDSRVEKEPAIIINNSHLHCTRCGFECEKDSYRLTTGNYFCANCIQMGRLDDGMNLVHIPEPNKFEVSKNYLTWQGQLTREQTKCSSEILTSIEEHNNHLLWAVTGAGKTEMLFLVIEWALKQKWRIAIASPRVDVCTELFPRVQSAFSDVEMCLLHGKSKKGYQYTQLTICTTHQLMRFKEAFDLLIIDEVDAFPYVNDESLHYAARNSVKKSGSTVWLTATPTNRMLNKIEKDHDKTSYLPLRFHGHLLPQINPILSWKWKEKLAKGKLPNRLLELIKNNIKRKQRFLLFVPEIKDLKAVSMILKNNNLDHKNWKTVYSSDPLRMEKVQMMRDEEILFLITTTILERGVTFPDIDVIILGADDQVFTPSSLVQIAGRVGRKKTRPTGNVDYFIGAYTKNVKEARKQIKKMNCLGGKIKNAR